eukprot:CAMPEP_0201940582 /NCGR_PEP_ID=MMETSP0903-20130614/45488_1 /ASSEMBLY_ACC=CAM_ASM_000552 /TAXON_ID=420261 /ORGANISM="Thalassiosira antarctica, Strain CCMP982" /LENGTH=663 /DNA_ID=CAMNT_0048482421 /DNA_START=196 /DNA_END=2187 /DNA_ORIENTATION=-
MILGFLLLCGASHSFTLPFHPGHHRISTTALNYLTDSDLPSSVSPPSEALQQQQQRPVRRSFLHQLDRFLTELQGAHDHLRNHTFLSGNFAPVSKEHVSVSVEVVEGSIPENLDGAFLRNGPNPIRDMQKKRYHWFDGHAMLHTLVFKNGKARYTNQFIPSPRFSIERELGEEYFPTMGEYKGMLGLMKLTFHPQLVKEKISDLLTVAPPNTNIMMYNNKLYCLHEASLPMECRMRPDSRLEYIGYETFDGVLDYPVSAHPVKDGDDLLFHSYSVDDKLIQEHGTMKVGRFSASTQSVNTYFVPTPTKSHVSFAHSLIHTDNYIIMWDCSVHFCTDALFMGGSFFRNKQDYTLKFGLIPKDATSRDDVIWIDSGVAGAIVHPLHAWEEVIEEHQDGQITSSRTTIKLWTPFCKDLELDLEKSNTFHMIEFTIDMNTKTVSQEVIDDTINSEFATMPPKPSRSSSGGSSPPLVSFHSALQESALETSRRARFNTRGGTTKRYTTLSIHERYGYTAIFGDKGDFTGYAKWDMVRRCLHSTVYYDNDDTGGEPMLVRATKKAADTASGAEEDAIYVGSYVYNKEENQSYFVLYDGETNEKVCRLKMPSRVPFGFHGTFISGKDFDSHFQYHEALDNQFNAQCPMKWIRFFIKDYILGHPPGGWSAK